eukprot:SAG31_NODE_6566_length_1973_cov_1.434899_2_plen_326_part_00
MSWSQAHTARRAERSQQRQAQELHIAEEARQREHQMMTAQIERTHHALDQCCRPVQNDLWAIVAMRQMMVAHVVEKLEASHPDAVAKMLSFAKVTGAFQPDGTATSRGSGKPYWAPNPPAELTRAMGLYTFSAPTGVGYVIAAHDTFLTLSKPFCMELPTAILDIIDAEPKGQIAEMYRRYVRNCLILLVRRATETLRGHAAYLELPPKDWLMQTFSEMNWRSFTNAVFVQHWYAHTLSFERLLSEWSDGNFESSHQPANVQPFGGIVQISTWSQGRAEGKQAELIGMTSKAEVDSNNLFARLGSGQTLSFEIESPTQGAQARVD